MNLRELPMFTPWEMGQTQRAAPTNNMTNMFNTESRNADNSLRLP